MAAAHQTAPEQISVKLTGFADSEQANRFGHAIAETVRLISTVIDLERLDGITVSFDYDAALASLDRGFNETAPLKKTSTDLLLGVAMSAPVLREGVVKAHMIYYAPVVTALDGGDEESQRRALSLLAHECGHVEAIKHSDMAFPDRMFRPVHGKIHFLNEIAESIWSEYSACRISAIFGKELTSIYEDSFVSVLRVARDRTNAAIREYRLHADLSRVLQEAGQHICQPLKIGAYLFGHLDGLKLEFDVVPTTEAALRETQYDRCMNEMHEALRELWSRLGRWSDVAEFDVLENIAREALAERGMIFTAIDDERWHLDIPP
ncbi:MAG TPA: hypothetical protein VLL06_03620 [Nitrospiraceae bacterium]|nr:hypothetical protein [Nitrospiraceae bacterium]